MYTTTIFAACGSIEYVSDMRLRCTPIEMRLAIGSHHLEYGFPSTHTTNSVSAMLYLYTLIQESQISPELSYIVTAILVFYAGSVVLGRIYCGMHSISDCVAGAMLGTLAWSMQLHYGQWLDDWMTTPGLTGEQEF
jgi:dihydrosphingosine 1-phosphate phosphatase